MNPASYPYPGLRPYLESESDIFFGQDAAIQALLERLQSQRFVTLLGLSGCGKSSLLNAGLLANIRSRTLDGGRQPRWLIAVMKPGNNPLGRLEAELEKLFPDLAVRTEIEADTCGLERLVANAGLDPKQRVLIVVDQFEELFRYRRAEISAQREDKAAYFIKLLLQAKRAQSSQIYVLLAMRSEFLGDCATFYGLAEQVNYGTFLLPKMTRDQMEETIAGPLDDLNIGIDQDLVQLLLNETEDQGDGLPLLQHALRRMWENWQRRGAPDARLSMVDFKTFETPPPAGDSLVKHHLNDHLNYIYSALTPPQQLAAERLFRLLSEHDATGRVIRRPLSYDQLKSVVGEDLQPVVEVFRNVELGRTFLMPPAAEMLTGSTIDISHECLLRRWDLLKSWVDTEARDAKVFSLMADDADQASRHKFETGSRKPLAGATLDRYQDWRTQAQPTPVWARRYEGVEDPQLKLPLRQFEAAMEYLDWSIDSRKAEEAREAANQERIVKLEAKKKKFKFLAWTAGAAVVALGLALFSIETQRQQATTIQEAVDSNTELKNYALTELNRLKGIKTPTAQFDRTREVLEGVIALSERVTDKSKMGEDKSNGIAPLNPSMLMRGWLFLGVLDQTGMRWMPSSVTGYFIFAPVLLEDKLIVDQLHGNRITVKVYNNLREAAEPHSQGAIIQILKPNTVLQINSIELTGATRENVWANVKVVQTPAQ